MTLDVDLLGDSADVGGAVAAGGGRRAFGRRSRVGRGGGRRRVSRPLRRLIGGNLDRLVVHVQRGGGARQGLVVLLALLMTAFEAHLDAIGEVRRRRRRGERALLVEEGRLRQRLLLRPTLQLAL